MVGLIESPWIDVSVGVHLDLQGRAVAEQALSLDDRSETLSSAQDTSKDVPAVLPVTGRQIKENHMRKCTVTEQVKTVVV